MHDVVIQLGHCYRTSGFTGTSGHRGTEQEFVSQVGKKMAELLTLRGYDAITVLADQRPLPRANVFVALHQDGSVNSSARGASVGYPPNDRSGREIAQIWKAHYTKAGWPSGFRPDNYTKALKTYYGFRRIHADAKFLIEHGFATNVTDANWMWENIGSVVKANCDAISQYLGTGLVSISDSFEEGDMQIINDPNKQRMWAAWLKDGTQHVDEYSKYVPGAGTLMPNVSFVIDDQVAKGNIVRVG